jgi:hypothetical protein
MYAGEPKSRTLTRWDPPVPWNGHLAGGVGVGGGEPAPYPGGFLMRDEVRWRARRRHRWRKLFRSPECPPVDTRPMPTATGLRPTVEIDPPPRHGPKAVQVVAGRPRLVPRPPGRDCCPLGQPSRCARPCPTAPEASSRPVRLRVPAKHPLCVTPQQSIYGVRWLGSVDADQHSHLQTRERPRVNLLDKTLMTQGRSVTGQAVRLPQ